MDKKKLSLYYFMDDDVFQAPNDSNDIPQVEDLSHLNLTPHPDISHLGKNSKRISFIVSYANEQHLPIAQLDFLSKILNAIKLQIDDIGIYNVAKIPEEALENIVMSNQKLIFLGVNPFLLGIKSVQANKYEIVEENNKSILHADTLEDIVAKTDLKSALWINLQRLFKI